MIGLRKAVRSVSSTVGLSRKKVSHQSRKGQVWSIGIYEGRSLNELMPSAEVNNPVLSRDSIRGIDASFVADPFVVRANGTWHMFFEVWNKTTRKGEIGLATSADGLSWAYQSIVISESFHLSYPCVFAWEDQYFMIPECGSTGSIRLYIADRFPCMWRHERTLLKGHEFADPSIIHWDGRWWLFTGDFSQRTHDLLRLYSADSLLGPWIEHPKSPLIHDDPHIARPAGRFVAMSDGIVRFTQDCFPRYGASVSAFRIVELSPTTYQEEPLQPGPILTGSGSGWNAFGMHHIDPYFLDGGHCRAFVDGCIEVEM